MKRLILFLCFGIFFGMSHAQVTVGSQLQPMQGALLDLKEFDSQGTATSTKGLSLPRVNLKKLDALNMGNPSLTLDPLMHLGLMVYNMWQHDETTIPANQAISVKGLICPGVHVWDGDQWQALVPYRDRQSIRCDGKIIETPLPIDPEEVPVPIVP